MICPAVVAVIPVTTKILAVVLTAVAAKTAKVEVLLAPERVMPPTVSVCDPVAMLVLANRFSAPDVSVIAPIVSA